MIREYPCINMAGFQVNCLLMGNYFIDFNICLTQHTRTHAYLYVYTHMHTYICIYVSYGIYTYVCMSDSYSTVLNQYNTKFSYF